MASTTGAKFVLAFVTLNLAVTFGAAVALYGVALLFAQGDNNEADSSSNFSFRMPFTFCSGGSVINLDSYRATTLCLPLPGIA